MTRVGTRDLPVGPVTQGLGDVFDKRCERTSIPDHSRERHRSRGTGGHLPVRLSVTRSVPGVAADRPSVQVDGPVMGPATTAPGCRHPYARQSDQGRTWRVWHYAAGRGRAGSPVPERQRPPLGGARQPHRSPQSQGAEAVSLRERTRSSGLSSVIDEHPGEFSGAQGESQGSVAEGGGAAVARRQRPRWAAAATTSVPVAGSDGPFPQPLAPPPGRPTVIVVATGRPLVVAGRSPCDAARSTSVIRGVGPALCVGQAVPSTRKDSPSELRTVIRVSPSHLGRSAAMRTMPPWLLWRSPPIPVVLFRVLGVLGGRSRSSAWRTAMRVARTLSRGSRGVRDVEQGGHLAVGQAVRRRWRSRSGVRSTPDRRSRAGATGKRRANRAAATRPCTPGPPPQEAFRARTVAGRGEYVRPPGHAPRSPRTASSRWRIRTQGDHVVMEDGPDPSGAVTSRPARSASPSATARTSFEHSLSPARRAPACRTRSPRWGPHRTRDPVSWQNRQ